MLIRQIPKHHFQSSFYKRFRILGKPGISNFSIYGQSGIKAKRRHLDGIAFERGPAVLIYFRSL